MASVGIIANPLAGRDVRRVAARAERSLPEEKRNRVARAVIGAVAAGADRVLVMDEPFRVSRSAVESLQIEAEIEVVEIGARLSARDTERAASRMRAAGCAALVVVGGDGTSRAVAKAWPDAPLIPLTAGTNNVFPFRVEPTIGGAVAGLIASGRLRLEEVAAPAKLIRVDVEDEPGDLALVDVVLLVDDFVGNLLPFDPTQVRQVVLARAEPAAVGTSALGGLLQPAGAEDDFGVFVDLAPGLADGQPLLLPVSPGLYRRFGVRSWRRLALGETVRARGPAVLAFDGDRERRLAAGQTAELRVVREGPRVIDVTRAMTQAAARGLFRAPGPWHDAHDRFRREAEEGGAPAERP